MIAATNSRVLLTLVLMGCSFLVGQAGPITIGDVSVWDSSVPPWPLPPAPIQIIPVGGSGQINGQFATDTVSLGRFGFASDSWIQLGIRAEERFIGPLTATAHDKYADYFAPGGTSTPSGSNNALWNFDLHVDFGSVFLANQLGRPVSPLAAGFFDVWFDIDPDPGLMPLFQSYRLTPPYGPLPPSTVLWQASQNLGFDYLGFNNFDPTLPGVYDFQLSAYKPGDDRSTTGPMAFAAMRVVVRPVPEIASTIVLLLLGCLGIGVFARTH